jgi:hypothetical protein
MEDAFLDNEYLRLKRATLPGNDTMHACKQFIKTTIGFNHVDEVLLLAEPHKTIP